MDIRQIINLAEGLSDPAYQTIVEFKNWFRDSRLDDFVVIDIDHRGTHVVAVTDLDVPSGSGDHHVVTDILYKLCLLASRHKTMLVIESDIDAIEGFNISMWAQDHGFEMAGGKLVRQP
jgi:hypothetical protein